MLYLIPTNKRSNITFLTKIGKERNDLRRLGFPASNILDSENQFLVISSPEKINIDDWAIEYYLDWTPKEIFKVEYQLPPECLIRKIIASNSQDITPNSLIKDEDLDYICKHYSRNGKLPKCVYATQSLPIYDQKISKVIGTERPQIINGYVKLKWEDVIEKQSCKYCNSTTNSCIDSEAEGCENYYDDKIDFAEKFKAFERIINKSTIKNYTDDEVILLLQNLTKAIVYQNEFISFDNDSIKEWFLKNKNK